MSLFLCTLKCLTLGQLHMFNVNSGTNHPHTTDKVVRNVNGWLPINILYYYLFIYLGICLMCVHFVTSHEIVSRITFYFGEAYWWSMSHCRLFILLSYRQEHVYMEQRRSWMWSIHEWRASVISQWSRVEVKLEVYWPCKTSLTRFFNPHYTQHTAIQYKIQH